MTKQLIVLGAMVLMLTFTATTSNLNDQNATTNASNAAGNMTSAVNRTAAEAGQNASVAANKTGEALQEFGKNASEVGGEILNKTGEAAQKIGAGAAGVLGNLTGEIKEGISGNNSKQQKSKLKTLLFLVANIIRTFMFF